MPFRKKKGIYVPRNDRLRDKGKGGEISVEEFFFVDGLVHLSELF